jgi:aminoglycoside 6'-N-acetyltransferase
MPLDPPPPPLVEGAGLRLRLAKESDIATLHAIVQEPEIAPWWPLEEAPHEEFMHPEAPTYVIEIDGEPTGLLMFHEEGEPGYRSAGMDVAVSQRFHGHGIGRRALVAMARHLFTERGHHRLTIDPAARNARAIACYERIGFRPVGIMRAYERAPDGTWRDGLLMDMLATELLEESEPTG